MLEMRASLDRIYGGVRATRSIREQAGALVQRLREAGQDVEALESASKGLAEKLTVIENDLMQTRNEADQDVENFPTKVDNQLAYVYGLVGDADTRPTESQVERYRDLEKEARGILARLKELQDADLPAFNRLAAEKGGGPVIVPKPKTD
jgi:hypothetical protein